MSKPQLCLITEKIKLPKLSKYVSLTNKLIGDAIFNFCSIQYKLVSGMQKRHQSRDLLSDWTISSTTGTNVPPSFFIY